MHTHFLKCILENDRFTLFGVKLSILNTIIRFDIQSTSIRNIT